MSATAITTTRGCQNALVERFNRGSCATKADLLAVEEPLEIRLAYGPAGARKSKPISVTMRTPGSDAELAAGFLMTEGVIHNRADIDSIEAGPLSSAAAEKLHCHSSGNIVTVELAPSVQVSLDSLQRNFYTTSSCGVCGKSSLRALRTICPPRRANDFSIGSATLCALPEKLRHAQGIFDQTGGLHAAGLFTASGDLDSMREDVGRHNAVDKLMGAALLADRVPLRNRLLLLSGRASFELLQKAVMSGVPMVAAVGAPSSLAVEMAREFDVTLVGFLRGDHFNVYHGASRIHAGEPAALRQ